MRTPYKREPLIRTAQQVLVGQTVRFQQFRHDGEVFYIVGMAERTFRPAPGFITIRVHGKNWSVPLDHAVEVL